MRISWNTHHEEGIHGELIVIGGKQPMGCHEKFMGNSGGRHYGWTHEDAVGMPWGCHEKLSGEHGGDWRMHGPVMGNSWGRHGETMEPWG